MTTVLIIDDHEVTRMGLNLILASDSRLQVKGYAQDGKSALAQARQLQPGLILLDLGLPATDTLSLIETFRKELPNSSILVVSGNNNPNAFARARQFGAHGLAIKTDPPEELLAVIGLLIDGATTAETPGVQALLGHAERIDPTLTPRELQVLTMLAGGGSVAQLAGELHISPATVRKHRENILRKLSVHNLVDAIRVARRFGLVAD